MNDTCVTDLADAAGEQNRRSSSLYSRTTSQSEREPAFLGQDEDSTNERNLDLRPDASSVSVSPVVGETAPSLQLLEPKTYNPSNRTSSTPGKTVQPPQPPVGPRQSTSPPVPPFVQHPKTHVRTISLEEARDVLTAPGAINLLPEELRAQKAQRSKSPERLQASFLRDVAHSSSPRLPEASILLARQGRDRLVSSRRVIPSPPSPLGPPSPEIYPPMQESKPSCRAGMDPEKTIEPLHLLSREGSKEKAVETLGLEAAEQPRGRARERRLRNSFDQYYLPKDEGSSTSSESSSEHGSYAREIVEEYHKLLVEQSRTSPSLLLHERNDQDESVRNHIGMTPQPLFAKFLPSVRFPNIHRDQMLQPSLFHSHPGVTATDGPRCQDSSPSGLSSTSSSKHHRQSDRVSHYYPHVMSRKGVKEGRGVGINPSTESRETHKEPEVSAVGLPDREDPRVQFKDAKAVAFERPVDNEPLYQRTAKHVLKHAHILVRSSESPEMRQCKGTSAHDSDRPHRVTGLDAGTKPLGVHLGWSNTAKETFDKARSTFQHHRVPQRPKIVHLTTPAQPLDVNRRTPSVDEPAVDKRLGMFDNFMNNWRKNKTQNLKNITGDVEETRSTMKAREISVPRPSLASTSSTCTWI